MPPNPYPPLVEAFLIVDQPRQRLSHWTKALAPLDDGRAPALAGVTAYYDPDVDQALLGVRYDELALGRDKLAFVVEIALLAEIGMIQPAELTEGNRKRFLGERLARCSVHVTDQRNVVASLTELVRYLREQRPAQPSPTAVRTPAARASLVPRGKTRDVLLVTPKSTRDDLPPQEREPSRVVDVPPMPPLPAPAPARAFARPSSMNVVTRSSAVHRAATAKIDASEVRRLADSTVDSTVDSTIDDLLAEGTVTEPYLPTTGATPAGIIYARFLRSGRWVPVRIGALSLKGAALLSGALPRLHDRVDVALTFGDHRALVRGPVAKVSSVEETLLSGTATFSVTFELDEASRRQLVALLTAARAANVTIKPPPPRQARRFPVEWPVCLGTPRGAVRAEALDVSAAGMFVRPMHPHALDTTVQFSSVIDDGNAPISGRARVVRHVPAEAAAAYGLAAGYGLRVLDMGATDTGRWADFLARVARRAGKRVLVGASPARLAELQAALSAAGYAVTGGTDPGVLVQLASSEPRPVDAALIDATWLAPGQSATWVESLFSARNVPFVTMHGDVRRARTVIDKLLAVA